MNTQKQQIFLLIDRKYDPNFFLIKKFNEAGILLHVIDIPNYTLKDRTVKFRIILLYFKYLIQATRAFRQSKKGDILITWIFTPAIGVGFINRLFNRKRKILALNLIAHSSAGFLSKIRASIFHYAMNQPDFHTTINDADYIFINADRFHVPVSNFHILHDPLENKLDINKLEIKDKGYIFCGGEAQRDWKLYLDIATLLPEIKFIGIARKKFFSPQWTIPENVEMHYDVDYQIFSRYMAEASIILLPLKSTLPCGLLVIVDASVLKKPVIATATPSTRNYISENKTGYLVQLGDTQNFLDKITYLSEHPEEKQRLGNNLHQHIESEYSTDVYFNNLINILNVCFK